MRKYLIFGLLVVILLGTIGVLYKYVQKQNLKISQLANNLKASEQGTIIWKDKYNREHSKIIETKNTLYEFKNSKDSLTNILQKVIDDSKIKTKSLQEAGIIITELKAKLITNSTNTTTVISNDSIKCQVIRDSTFLLHIVCLDPKQDMIKSIETNINNTQSILFINHKETINPPREFFLWRLFQKKQIICNIEVINSNPYLHTTKSKFIKIINK